MSKPFGAVAKDKPFKSRLRIRLLGSETAEELDIIVGQLVSQAKAGEAWAVKEIIDRLDGKPQQETTVTMQHVKAAELSDDELARIAAGSGEGTNPTPVDPKQLN